MAAKSKLKKAQNEELENLLAFHLQINGLGHHFVRQHRHIEGRQFRLDFADPVNRVGIEVQGGIWMPGKSGHNWGTGIEAEQPETMVMNQAHRK